MDDCSVNPEKGCAKIQAIEKKKCERKKFLRWFIPLCLTVCLAAGGPIIGFAANKWAEQNKEHKTRTKVLEDNAIKFKSDQEHMKAALDEIKKKLITKESMREILEEVLNNH